MWSRYVALDDAPQRAEVEALIAQHRVHRGSISEDTQVELAPELTESNVLASEIVLESERRAAPTRIGNRIGTPMISIVCNEPHGPAAVNRDRMALRGWPILVGSEGRDRANPTTA